MRTTLRQRLSVQGYNARHPHRKRATGLVNIHIAYGKIVKPEKCFICSTSDKQLIGHHENYALPLDVIWVCWKCHCKRHKYLRSVNWVDFILPIEQSFPVNNIQPDAYNVEAFDKLLTYTNFTVKEVKVMKLRAKGLTLRKIGEILKITGEGIRCILIRAEKKYINRGLLKVSA
ncbi:MAG: hypothetical protein ACUZ9M_00845 [Candidatus Scalindua sp.]